MPTLRIPLSYEYDSRSTNSSYNNTDSRRLNVIDEPRKNAEGVYTRPRPAFVTSGSTGQLGIGQAVTSYQSASFAVVNDMLVAMLPPNSGTDAVSFTSQGNAAWAARTQYKVLVQGDTMHIISGWFASSSTNSDVWQTRDGTNWTCCTASAPFGPRMDFGAVVLNGQLFVLGGGNPATLVGYSDVWSSPDGTNWTQLSSGVPWGPRSGFGCVVANNGIYVIGGWVGGVGGGARNDVWFSTDGAVWDKVAASSGWAARSWFGCEYLNNTIYVWGGSTGGISPFYNDCWASTNGGVTWTQMTASAFSSSRYAMGTCVYNNKLWSIAGGNSSFTQLSEVWSSTNGSSWTLVTNAPGWNGREYPGVGVFSAPPSLGSARYATIWVMGGHTQGTPATNDVWYGNLDIAITSTTALNPTVEDQLYQFNSFVEGTQLLVKNQSNMWVYRNGGVDKVTDAGYPLQTVPGIVVFGANAYVMDPTGLIRNCAQDEPMHWPSLGALGADYDDDPGVAIAKYMNFLVAFGTFTTQFFYDAGKTPGSPLLPYANANMKIGCADARSIVEMSNTIVWASQSKQGHRQIVALNGLTPQAISTPMIDTMLDTYGVANAYGYAIDMHTFYVITFNNNRPSWAYDFLTKQWYEWTSGTGGTQAQFIGTAFVAEPGDCVLLSTFGDWFIQMVTTGTDYTGAAPIRWITPKVDADNNRTKFWGQVELIGDTTSSAPTIQFSDDDYTSWSAPRSVFMNDKRPVLYRNGASRRRAFRVNLTQNPFHDRFEALEITFEQGN